HEVSDAFFVREARWIDGTGVIIALMLSRTFLNVSRRRVNRRHHRAGRGIGYLASMYGAGGKFVLLFHGQFLGLYRLHRFPWIKYNPIFCNVWKSTKSVIL